MESYGWLVVKMAAVFAQSDKRDVSKQTHMHDIRLPSPIPSLYLA